MRAHLLPVVLMLLLLSVSALWADTLIGDWSHWNGYSSIGSFAHYAGAFGQTFRVPTAAYLDYFSLAIETSTTDPFRTELYAWDGAKATGANLWESAPTSVSTPMALQQFTFHPDQYLTPDAQYVFFVAAIKDPGSGGGSVGAVETGDWYTGGSGYTGGACYTTADWTSNPWGDEGFDLAFEANFNDGPGGGGDVPEPCTMALLVVGLAGFGGLKRRLKKG
jgi:hypothetical protein